MTDVYIYTHTHTHTHIYIYIYRRVSFCDGSFYDDSKLKIPNLDLNWRVRVLSLCRVKLGKKEYI